MSGRHLIEMEETAAAHDHPCRDCGRLMADGHPRQYPVMPCHWCGYPVCNECWGRRHAGDDATHAREE